MPIGLIVPHNLDACPLDHAGQNRLTVAMLFECPMWRPRTPCRLDAAVANHVVTQGLSALPPCGGQSLPLTVTLRQPLVILLLQ